MQAKTYKCVLLGYKNVGKSVYLNQVMTGNFDSRYVATLGVEVHPLLFNYDSVNHDSSNPTENKKVVFNVWDCAGDPNFSGLTHGYYTMADMAIIMFDGLESFQEAKEYLRQFKRVINKDVPIAFVWSKYDNDADNEALTNEIHAFKAQQNNSSFYFGKVNTKKHENLLNPFTFLLRKALQDDSLLISN